MNQQRGCMFRSARDLVRKALLRFRSARDLVRKALLVSTKNTFFITRESTIKLYSLHLIIMVYSAIVFPELAILKFVCIFSGVFYAMCRLDSSMPLR